MMPNVIPIGSAWHGASPEDWDQFSLLLGLTRDLLPVVSNPEAVISPQSGMQSLGKTPSIYNGERQVVGLAKWTQRETTMAAVETWSHERDYGICLQTREVRALDVDIDDPDEAAEVARAIYDHLVAPVRSRANSAKFLQAFRMPGDYGKRRIKTAHGMIEFLATGQQFVAVGRHPSGVKYEWTWPDGEDFPTLSPAEFEALWAALQAEFGVEPSTESSTSSKLDKLRDAAVNDPVAQHLQAQGLIKRQERDGRLHITCPWEHEHTTDTGDSSTTYWPAHTGGYEQGHFHCLHAHCEHRTDDQFLAAVEFKRPGLLDGFADLSGEPAASPAHRPRFYVHSAADLYAMPLPSYWIKHVLPKVGLCVIYGEPASGKSFFVLDLVMAVARGVPWRDQRVHQGRVVYIAAEGQASFNKRVRAYANQHDVDVARLPIGFITDAPNLQDQPVVQELWQQVKVFGRPAIIVIDTLAQVMPGGDENSSEAMGKIISACQEMHKRSGALVILIHHSGKDVSRGARGWSGLKGAVDVEIEITREEEVRTARMSKMKDDIDNSRYAFTLPTIAVGIDEDEEVSLSCYCEPEEIAAPTAKGYRPKGPWEVAVMEALRTIGLAQSKGIEVAAVVEEGKRHVLKPESGRDRRAEYLRRAITSLAEKGLFILDTETETIELPVVVE